MRPSRCDDEEDDEAAAAAAAEEEPEYSSDAMVAVLWRFRSTKKDDSNISSNNLQRSYRDLYRNSYSS